MGGPKLQIPESLKSLLVPIDSIKPDHRNARKHPARNLAAIKFSLETYGQRKPIVVNSRTGQIEAGNGLWQAAKGLGWTQIAAVKVDDDGKTAAAYGIMDNQSALLADWEIPELLDTIGQIDTLEITGFTQEEIDKLESGDWRKEKIPEVKQILRPRHMLRVLISIPVERAEEAKAIIEQAAGISGAEIDYSAN